MQRELLTRASQLLAIVCLTFILAQAEKQIMLEEESKPQLDLAIKYVQHIIKIPVNSLPEMLLSKLFKTALTARRGVSRTSRAAGHVH